MREELERRLSAFDGKSTAMLKEVELAWSRQSDYLRTIVGLSGSSDEAVAGGASWLVLNGLKGGIQMSAELTERYLRTLVASLGWAHALHVCQSIQHVSVCADTARIMVPCLLALGDHERPFVRTWSMDGLVKLSRQHDEFRVSAETAVSKGFSDKAASVRARARRLSTGG